MNKRLLDLLSALSETEYLSAAALGEKLHASSRTIRNLIHESGELLQQSGATIEAKHGFGYRLRIDAPDRHRSFLRSLSANDPVSHVPSTPDERLDYILYALLTRRDHVKLATLEAELFVTRNTVSADIKKLEVFLSEHHLSLDRRANHGIRLCGREPDIRHLAAFHIAQTHPGDLWYFAQTSEEMRIIASGLKDLFSQHQLSVPDSSLQNLNALVYVAAMRIRCGFLLPDALDNAAINRLPEYSLAQNLTVRIGHTLSISFPSQEVTYIAVHLAGKKVYRTATNANIVISPRISGLVDEMLDQVHDVFAFDCQNDIELKMSLAQHLIALEIRSKYGLRLQNPLLEDIKRNHALAYQMAIQASAVIDKAFSTRLYDDEIGYIAFSFGLALERRNTQYDKKNILLVCATGKGSAKLLMYKYRSEFDAQLGDIHTCDVSELSGIDFSRIDYVIATVPIHVPVPVPILRVQYFLSAQDRQTIHKALKKTRGKSTQTFYRRDLFMPCVKARTREEVIEKMCMHIAAHTPLPEGFQASVLRREQLARTEFGNMIAMPHPDHTITEETIVCVAILENEILWDQKLVQAVFMVSVANDPANDMRSFYNTTSKFLLSEQGVKELIGTRSFDRFIELLNAFEE